MSGPIVWSEPARALFELTGSTGVSAGAGSGKTTCLVELCLRLFSGEATGSSCDPSEVIAITFTEKAAKELQERLRSAVADRAEIEARGGSQELSRAWRVRLHALDRMAVGTIHGFARRLLAEHAIEAGLEPELEILDEEAANDWRAEAARGAVVAALDEGRPEAMQLAAALGAGGRRAGLAEAVADIVRERATLGDRNALQPAPEPLAEALAARREAVAEAEALLAARGEARTDSGVKAMSRLAQALGRLGPTDREGPLQPTALSAIPSLGEALKGWRTGKSDGAQALAHKDGLVRACETFRALAAEVLAGPQKAEWCALVMGAEERYAARKRAARALDFDDLLVEARDLLRGDAALRAELRGRYRALLVDEYQDVNGLQQEIFELLGGAPDGERGPLLVAVGDLKQSIYRFRGADVAVFRGLLERLREPPGRVLHLSRNHRSGPAVLDLVNEVFSRCMQPTGGEPRPYELSFLPDDRLIAVRRGGEGPACELLVDGEKGTAAELRRREAKAVAARIRGFVSGESGPVVLESDDGGKERPRTPSHGDIAILFRRLTQVGEYERALREAGIPYRLGRGGGFYQMPEVRDLGELLATLCWEDDALAWASVLRSPMCGLSDGALFAISDLGFTALARPGSEGAARALEDLGASAEAERLWQFLTVWHQLRALRDRLSVAELLEAAVERLDLEAAHVASPDGERRIANLRKALTVAARYQGRGTGAAGFATHLRRMAGRPPREPEAELDSGDAVTLLTVHQAKGLEWPIVFVPDLAAEPRNDARRAQRTTEGALAASYHDEASDAHATLSIEKAREENRRASDAEARRLLYVAMTRARDRLVLSGEGRRKKGTWRELVEAGSAGRSDLIVPIPYSEVGGASGQPVASDRPSTSVLPDLPARAPGPPSGAIRVSVTALAQHARCPRRSYWFDRLGLTEHQAAGSPRDDPDRATSRGTLAHAMLAEVDLLAGPLEQCAMLAAIARRRGFDPDSPEVRHIRADVARFLDSDPGLRLRDAERRGALRREVPFMLRVDGVGGFPSCYLVGAIDALIDDRVEVRIVDFKYALPRPGVVARYRLQLVGYALAASRALQGRRVAAEVQFLRGSCATVDVAIDEGSLKEFERMAPELAFRVLEGLEPTRTPSELGRQDGCCRAEGCGFVDRCWKR